MRGGGGGGGARPHVRARVGWVQQAANDAVSTKSYMFKETVDKLIKIVLLRPKLVRMRV